MNRLWMVVIVLLFAGCNQGETIAPPTALDFGDSVSEAYTVMARQDLYDTVDLRHDPWDKTDIIPDEVNEDFYIGEFISAARNDGFTLALLDNMISVLDGKHYNVIIFNSGIHDIQLYYGHPRTPLNIYQSRLEEIASIAKAHADIVIWVDTTIIPQGLDGIPNRQVPYNAVAHEIAREHGFYILTVPTVDQIPDNVHFYLSGYEAQGKTLAACVRTALSMAETDDCHK